MSAIAARVLPRGRNHDAVPSFLAALLMHAALIGWMWFAVQWRTNASPPAVAELWELPPIQASSPPPAPIPAPAAEPIPPPASEEPAPPKADIVQKQEAPHKAVEAPPKETPTKRENKPKRHDVPTPQEQRRQQAQAEKQHQEEMTRLASQAGGPVGQAGQAGQAGVPTHATAFASTGPISNEYAAKIQTAVRAHLSYAVPDEVPASVYAEFDVELLPTGEQAAEPRLTKPSGLPGFDEAARRAILRTDPFPRRDDGTVPRHLTLQLFPRDTR